MLWLQAQESAAAKQQRIEQKQRELELQNEVHGHNGGRTSGLRRFMQAVTPGRNGRLSDNIQNLQNEVSC